MNLVMATPTRVGRGAGRNTLCRVRVVHDLGEMQATTKKDNDKNSHNDNNNSNILTNNSNEDNLNTENDNQNNDTNEGEKNNKQEPSQ